LVTSDELRQFRPHDHVEVDEQTQTFMNQLVRTMKLRSVPELPEARSRAIQELLKRRLSDPEAMANAGSVVTEQDETSEVDVAALLAQSIEELGPPAESEDDPEEE